MVQLISSMHDDIEDAKHLGLINYELGHFEVSITTGQMKNVSFIIV